MERYKLQYIIKRAGFSQRDIARRLGVSDGMVSLVLSGGRRSRRLESEIAGLLGLDKGKVFPVLSPPRAGRRR